MDAVWADRSRSTAPGSARRASSRRGGASQQQAWLWSMLRDGLEEHFRARADVRRLLPELEAAVAAARITPTEAARRLLAVLADGAPPSRAR